ncbi:MAG: hypothetical protein L0229_18290 [Blastocatellia bacterium]|nr:hypothetical protein [Blastocatellia bacterium]
MTLQQAIKANVRIEHGHRITTLRGWCRHDRVLLDGREIGRIRTRRAKDRIEITTLSGNLYTTGYDIDWLIRQTGSESWF